MASMYEVTPMLRSTGLTPKVCAMLGSAVRITVVSSSSMNSAPAKNTVMSSCDGLATRCDGDSVTMRIAKPLLLVTTPIGVAAGLYEGWRLAGGLVLHLQGVAADGRDRA